ncbi:MAG TPA: hypothetical protein VNA18_07120, partial [Nitrososphaeraceae archaeon]|nr:hypothetical protein [Nitrososphaeraceae archaeon]
MYTVLEREYDHSIRIFALCEKCYWTATILEKVEACQCPDCLSQEVAMIPIDNDEQYEYSVAPK